MAIHDTPSHNPEKLDPRGLIREAYRMEGVGLAECRSIFLDWALGMPLDADNTTLIQGLLSLYGTEADHPMTLVLQDGLATAARTGRRGGRRGRQG